MIDKRLVFDSISQQFDKWREKYTPELFNFILKECHLDSTKKCLEIGPGTGQASDFAINSGCDYTAIELGENLAKVMKDKFGKKDNFKIIVGDFEKHDFSSEHFDLVYSAATIQWINQEIAYKKCFKLLNTNGYLAMFRMLDDLKFPNPELYEEIQKVYDEFFISEIPYTCNFDYTKGTDYGFKYIGQFKFSNSRSYSADDFVEYIKTHADHITLRDENREPFYNGIKAAVERFGKMEINSVYILDLYQK